MIYAWIWRQLPGDRRAKVMLVTLLLAWLLLACFLWLFPAISDVLASNGSTVGAPTSPPVLRPGAPSP